MYVPPSVMRPATDFPEVRTGGGWAGRKTDKGNPVPVPGVITDNWNLTPSPVNTTGGGDEGIPGWTDAGGEVGLVIEAPPPIFVPFEKEPMVISRVEPEYPEICRQVGLTGAVNARLWITREGKVRDVVIIKSDSEFFNQAVIDAAKQWIFTPALMNKGPVAVWRAVVFNFKLR